MRTFTSQFFCENPNNIRIFTYKLCGKGSHFRSVNGMFISLYVFLKKNSGGAFRLHRLDRIEEKFQSVTYDDEALEGAMQGYLEVR